MNKPNSPIQAQIQAPQQVSSQVSPQTDSQISSQISSQAGSQRLLAGKTALVTGAGSGIGSAIALLFAKQGATLLVTDYSSERAAKIADTINANANAEAKAFRLDVTLETDWKAVLTYVREYSAGSGTSSSANSGGGLDIVVNNAGISFAKALTDTTLDEWRNVMAVNLDGVFLGIKHALLAMNSRGSIINIASASGIKPAPGASAYSTSKAAVRMLTKVAALEAAERGNGVRVNAILPSGVRTPMWETMASFQQLSRDNRGDEAAWEALAQAIPLRRFAFAEEVAEAALYLASDASRFMTGAEMVLDGGFTAL